MELELQLNDIDYEDIYDNINDYEYPYNHIVGITLTRTHVHARICLYKK